MEAHLAELADLAIFSASLEVEVRGTQAPKRLSQSLLRFK